MSNVFALTNLRGAASGQSGVQGLGVQGLGAPARRRTLLACAVSMALHLALAAMVIGHYPVDEPGQTPQGGAPAMEIAYLAANETDSPESEAAPDQARPVEPPEPTKALAVEQEAGPPTRAEPIHELAMDEKGELAPPRKTVQHIRREPRPVARQSAEARPKTPRPAQPAAQPGRGTERQQSAAATRGGATVPEGAAGAGAQNWRGAVLAHLARFKQYPSLARDNNVTGTAIVAFTLSASGGVVGVSLARGSGSAQLDQATLAMVRRAAPFPAAPSGARMSFTTAINYSLR